MVGIAVMALGVLYWAAWRVFLPRIFHYQLVTAKETLNDGTVVTVVSVVYYICFCSPRSNIWSVQTPQAILMEALVKYSGNLGLI